MMAKAKTIFLVSVTEAIRFFRTLPIKAMRMNWKLLFLTLVSAALGWAQPLFAQCNPADTVDLVAFPDLDQAPLFPGGEGEFLKFLLKAPYPANLDSAHYLLPPNPLVVSFIVEADGTVTNICPLRNPDNPWMRALLQHLTELPQFLPGQKAGRAVRTRYIFPLRICLRG